MKYIVNNRKILNYGKESVATCFKKIIFYTVEYTVPEICRESLIFVFKRKKKVRQHNRRKYFIPH